MKDSELFREFLESGVLVLQDAHIISAKKAKLSRRKPATDQKKGTANTIETRPSVSCLSACVTNLLVFIVGL